MRKLYKPGNMIEVWGVKCDWKDVPEDEVSAHLADGWSVSPLDMEDKPAPARRGRKPKAKDDGDTQE